MPRSAKVGVRREPGLSAMGKSKQGEVVEEEALSQTQTLAQMSNPLSFYSPTGTTSNSLF